MRRDITDYMVNTLGYYNNNWKDLEKDKGTSGFKVWDRKRCVSEALLNTIDTTIILYAIHLYKYFEYRLLDGGRNCS